jgi:hypothetical protein
MQGKWCTFCSDIFAACKASALLCDNSLSILSQLCQEVCTFPHPGLAQY